MRSSYIKSPLNYIGGKYKILEQIIPKFPQNIHTFVDLFGGGFNVGVNVDAKHIIYNDVIEPLGDLMDYFAKTSSEEVIQKLEKNIERHHLSKENSQAFLKLRERYNQMLYENEEEKILDFYALILYSFNYQIRFNQNMKYNTPFGKNRSSYNANTQKNLKQFVDKMKQLSITISKKKFTDFDFSHLTEHDFVYCDPPYLITTGSYNDGNRGIKDWTMEDEKKLLSLLDDLHSRGILFALSNVLVANRQRNEFLIQWARKYHIHIIQNSFDHANYRRKNKKDTIEVLITNYEEEVNE